ncbi:MAG: MlaD family protein [Dietzia cercidiphylli]
MSDTKDGAPLKAPKGQLRFRDRDPRTIGIWGALGAVVLMGVSLNYDRIPYVNGLRNATAYVADAAGLNTGDSVQVAGMKVGSVRKIALDGDRVRVDFAIDTGVALGSDTSAQIKTDSILGRRALAV